MKLGPLKDDRKYYLDNCTDSYYDKVYLFGTEICYYNLDHSQVNEIISDIRKTVEHGLISHAQGIKLAKELISKLDSSKIQQLDATFEIQHDTTQFQKTSITSQYNHSQGISLKKLPIFYVSRLDAELVFQTDIEYSYSEFQKCRCVVYYNKTSRLKKSLTEHKFKEDFMRYDSSSTDYHKKLESVQTLLKNSMTPYEFFNSNGRTYSKTWEREPFSYDLVADPGFSTAAIDFKDLEHTIKMEIFFKQYHNNYINQIQHGKY